MKSFLLSGLFCLIAVFGSNAQCANPTVMLFEDFEGAAPVIGSIPGTTYGSVWNNAAYILSGAQHGWFNVVNGLGDIDVYDRTITGYCVGADAEISFWTRQSFGVTNVTFTAFDDLNNILATTTINLTNVYQQITFSFIASTPGVRFVIHCNSTGGNGVDIVMEDMLFTQCGGSPTEDIVYTDCSSAVPFDLFSFFTNVPVGGTWSGPSVLTNGGLGTFDPTVNTSGLYSYTEITNCGPVVSTVDVSLMNAIDLGNDTTFCSGNALILDAGPGFDSYLWSNGATTQTINATTSGTYSVVAGIPLSNIVLNGDFEGGTTAASNNFTTGYAVGSGGAWGLLSNAGEWAITTAANLVHNNFPGCTDHTTGATNMFVANGASVPNINVWSQTVPVTPNTDYLFSFWAMRVSNDPNPANLQLYINGVPIGPVNSTGGICTWVQAADSWNSGAAVSAVLSIVNQSTAGSGNDFALDDITFAPVCTATDTIVVSVQAPAQVVTFVDPSCNGLADGEIHVDNVLADDYSNDGGITWQVDSFFVNLPSGVYNVCSRTAIGCVVCQNVVLTDPPPVVVTASADVLICQNGSTDISAAAIGGTVFSYHWDFTADTTDTQNVSPINDSIFYVYAENENGCISEIDSVIVTVNPPLDGTISANVSICPGDQTTINATASGGMGAPYTFTWSSGAVNTTAGIDAITVTPASTTVYTVTVIDGCESTPFVISNTVTVSPVPEPSYLITSPPQCEPATFEIINTTDPNLSGIIDWTVNGTELFSNLESISTGPWMAGDYDLEMVVTSSDGCVGTAFFPGALVVQPVPVANFTYSPSPVTMFNTNVVFNNGSIGGAYYQWYFEEGSPATSTSYNTTTDFPDGQVGTYEVILIVESELGCFDTITQLVQVYPEVILYAPNTFTPDGDEFNQLWNVYIEGVDIYNFELNLYNRWGQQIWINKDPNQGWDGTYNGQYVQAGTYVWTITAKDLLNDSKYEFNGHVTILK
jgi:gliding motility-associated-like protein